MPYLARYEFLAYLNTNNKLIDDALERINRFASSFTESNALIEEANHLYVYDKIIKSDFKGAKNHLDTQFIGSDSSKQKLVYLSNVAQREVDESKAVKASAAPVVLKTYSLLDWAADPEELAALRLSPRDIHTYCQQQKATLSKQKPSTIDGNNPFSWNIDGKITYSTISESQKVYHLDNKPNYYATIDPALANRLDPAILSQLTAAIKKGVAARDMGTNGLKFLSNKVIELKIHSDTRLYTTQIYQNAEGKYLIVLNKGGNHEAVGRELVLSKGISTIVLDGITMAEVEEVEDDVLATPFSLSSFSSSSSSTTFKDPRDDPRFEDEVARMYEDFLAKRTVMGEFYDPPTYVDIGYDITGIE